MEYQRLGDYIREVNVRNSELKVTKLMGISMTKKFRPSTSNVVGTDLSNYKIVEKNIFVFDTMSVIRVHKVPIAINNTVEPIIVSPAYHTFEVIDPNTLMPEYLMMWFCRTEFDRYADFKSDSAIRGGYGWNELCDTIIDVPALTCQREIVEEYETLSRRVRLNEQMIARLEETAQALYRKMFVVGIDKENLPEGWRRGKLGEIAEITSGKTCVDKSDTKNEMYQYPVAGASGIIGYSTAFNQNEALMTTGRVGTLGIVNRYNEKLYTADNVLVIKTAYYEYCFQVLNSIDYAEITKGGVQSLITQTDLKQVEIAIPPKQAINEFEEHAKKLFGLITNKQKENEKLTELQSLLLARMGKEI